MKLLRYVIAGGVIALVCTALDRRHAHRQPRAVRAAGQEGTAAVEKSVQQAALLRARSEVASGEFDMQG